jgi:hypothetical protein
LHKGGREIEARITLTSRVNKKIWNIQGGPNVGIQYIVYSVAEKSPYTQTILKCRISHKSSFQ